MQKAIQQFLRCRTIAVVGATNRPAKFGYKIFANLRRRGYNVLPVHPTIDQIDGVRVYRTLAEAPAPVEAVDIVVPPGVTEEVVRECARLGIRFVWMQPGAESRAAIDFCEESGITCIHGTCVMVHSA